VSIPVKHLLNLDEGATLAGGKGLAIGNGTPSVVTDTFYQVDSVLYWNGAAVPNQTAMDLKLDKPTVTLITGTHVLTNESIVLINSATDCAVFLPEGVDGKNYRMRNIGVGKITFMTSGANTVEGAVSYQLLTTNAFDLVFYSNNWYIL